MPFLYVIPVNPTQELVRLAGLNTESLSSSKELQRIGGGKKKQRLIKDTHLHFQKWKQGQFCKMIISNLIRESIVRYVHCEDLNRMWLILGAAWFLQKQSKSEELSFHVFLPELQKTGNRETIAEAPHFRSVGNFRDCWVILKVTCDMLPKLSLCLSLSSLVCGTH